MANEFVSRNGIIAKNNVVVSGSLAVTGSGISLNGVGVVLANQTSSLTSLSASFASTASFIQNAQSASYVLNAVSASYVLNAVSSSFATLAQTASNADTASYVLNAQSASYVLNAISASNAATASSADNFTVRGTLIAQTIVAQTITSSTDFVTGSTRFGSLPVNTHSFTGSVDITGSLSVTSGITGSLFGTASNANTASYVLNAVSASYWSGSIINAATASYVIQAQSASYWSGSVINAATASYVIQAQSASYWSGSIINAATASYVILAQTASYVVNALTASFVANAVSSSYALTASFALNGGGGGGSGFPFSGSGVITGSLLVSGSFIVSGTVDFSNANIDNSRYLHSQTSVATTWSVNHNLEYSYPNVTIYDSTGYVIQPDEIISVDNNTTSVLFNISQSGYANVSVGGISTGQADRFLFTQTSATGSWVINHGLNYKYVNVDIYDNNDQLMIPQVVTATDVNTLTVTFVTPTAGNAIISKGGARTTSLFVDRSNGNYSFSGSMNVTGSGIFSGDVDADNFNTTSDFRLKTNLEIVEGALDKIESLNGYTFDWITEYSGDKTKQIGLVAQEVYAVQPELISYREFNQEEIMVLDYSKVTALLVNAVKELSAKVKDLESKINN